MPYSDKRRDFLKFSSLAIAVGLTSTACYKSDETSKSSPSDLDNLFVIDGLGALFDINRWADDMPFEMSFSEDMVNDISQSGLACIRHTTGIVDQSENAFQKAITEVAWSHRWLYENNRILALIRSPNDIFEARKKGKVGVTFTVQNCHSIGDDLSRVKTFFDLGIQTFQLTYNSQNQFGGGSNADGNIPLTKAGYELVGKINETKALLDLSHSGRQTCLDAIAASSSPVIISHSGCRVLNDIPRNKTDEEMRKIADSGGVFGIYFMPFLAENGQATSEHLIAHIEHALNICGEDHVSIGTDGTYGTIDDMEKVRAKYKAFTQKRIDSGNAARGEFLDNVNLLPDIAGANQFRLLAEKLSKRGHSQKRIAKILGENELRMMREVWPS